MACPASGRVDRRFLKAAIGERIRTESDHGCCNRASGQHALASLRQLPPLEAVRTVIADHRPCLSHVFVDRPVRAPRALLEGMTGVALVSNREVDDAEVVFDQRLLRT